MSQFNRKLSACATVWLAALVASACGPSVGEPSAATEEQASTYAALAVGYNTPGPQVDDAGVPLGTQTNPFTLIVTQKFADVTHKDAWAIDPLEHYGTFHQLVVLSGVPQYKWLQCGTVGAGC